MEEWNVRFAERIASKERRYSSWAMNYSYALRACLDCGRKGFLTVKSGKNIVLMVICGKAAL
jgi:hypothetical protein